MEQCFAESNLNCALKIRRQLRVLKIEQCCKCKLRVLYIYIYTLHAMPRGYIPKNLKSRKAFLLTACGMYIPACVLKNSDARKKLGELYAEDLDFFSRNESSRQLYTLLAKLQLNH